MKKEDKEIILKGMPASLGIAEGKVKIIAEYGSIEKMDEGDILVAPYTTPLLTPAILKAAGIITETGGIACHAAIVARELGIPCIVGAENATKILKDGMKIAMDSKGGEVYVE